MRIFRTKFFFQHFSFSPLKLCPFRSLFQNRGAKIRAEFLPPNFSFTFSGFSHLIFEELTACISLAGCKGKGELHTVKVFLLFPLLNTFTSPFNIPCNPLPVLLSTHQISLIFFLSFSPLPGLTGHNFFFSYV